MRDFSHHTEEELAYADDLETMSSSHEVHSLKMDIVSAFCAFTSLLPAAHKIKSCLIRLGVIPSILTLPIRDHTWSSTANSKVGDIKYLGVRPPLILGPISLDEAILEATTRLRGLLNRIWKCWLSE